ncbi:MAG: hypothetical protein AB7U85_01675 [Alphaproteobacteria bacterium]
MTKYYAQVRYELIAKTAKIRQFLKQGYTRHSIYNELKEKREITCSKASFYRFIKKHINLKDFMHPEDLRLLARKELQSREETTTIPKFRFDPKRKIPDEEL